MFVLFWKIAALVIAYLLGNFNSGILFSKLLFHKDIREHGSKNPGTTNAFRILGKGAGSLVLFADTLKGALAILIAGWLAPGSELWLALAGVCVTLGHIFPVLFKFKGGKGMATTSGVALAAQPVVYFTLLGPFCAILFGTRYMSLASLSVALLLPPTALAWNGWRFTPLIWMYIFQGITIIATHHANIRRLLNGTENRLFNNKKHSKINEKHSTINEKRSKINKKKEESDEQ
ncbi:MAG: glycerol-3-phosphate 1-O-acyltransferase PlsY [Oscillospiraceae bacterium]|nr:glycerol-3-phosphate 1-O-acyltransferase PlsY [Oscillospiraceae bacterium]